MRAAILLILIVLGYGLLLLAPGVLPSDVGMGGFVFLALTWICASLWFAGRVLSPDYAFVVSAVALLALLALPFNVLLVGCQVFNQCV
jgi:hypothetical protein